MINSNFFKIFKTFNKKEALGFENYLQWAHPGEKVAFSVYKYLRKFHPVFEDPDQLEIDYAYKKIFGADAVVNSKKVNNVLSELSGWAKEFLLVEEIKKDTIEGELLLSTILKERKLERDFLKSSDKLEALRKTKKITCVADYLCKATAAYQIYYQKENKGMHETAQRLNAVIEETDIAFAVSKLKMACEMQAYNHMGAAKMEINDMAPVLEIAGRYAANNPLLDLYYAVYKVVFDASYEHLTKTMELLQNHTPAISTNETHDIITHLRNFTGKKIEEGDDRVWVKGHQLNEMSLKAGLFQKEKMSGVTFSNIVNIACVVNEVDWARQFIQEVSPSLPKSVRHEAVTVSEANIAATLKDYEYAASLLKDQHFRDIRLNIIARSFTLKIYYLMGKDYEETMNQCAAFTAFLNRQTVLSKGYLIRAVNYIKMIKLLVNIPPNKESYLEELENHRPVLFYKWLKEMSPKR